MPAACWRCRLRDKLHLILGFSAGAVIGVAFFDLLPEAIDFGEKFHCPGRPFLSCTALGFLSYLVLDRILLFHGDARAARAASPPACSACTACSTASPSGSLFKRRTQVGIVVAIAVLTHDFSDGINTMNIVLKNRGNRTQASALAAGGRAGAGAGNRLDVFLHAARQLASAPCSRCLPVSSSTSAPAI